MVSKHVTVTRLVLAVVLCTMLLSAHTSREARADDPSPTIVVSTPAPTVAAQEPAAPEGTAPPTAIPTTMPVTPETQPPTVVPDVSTPLVTAPPAVRAESVPTIVEPSRSIATVRPTVPVQTEPALPPVQAVTAPPSAPLPSAAELQANARLRWGDRVPPQVRRWAFLIVPAARKYHLDPDLIAAVMTMESNGDPLAWSQADARGLMQILHGPWDPKRSVYIGARMLAGLLDRFGSLRLALAAYNAGPEAVVAYGGVPPYRETRDYVIIVEYLYDLFSHHRLTLHRRAQYRSTLKDLQHFASQRKKIVALARAAHLLPAHPGTCQRLSPACLDANLFELSEANHPSPAPTQTSRLFLTMDPFWPVGDVPDPLQRVDPFRNPAR